MEALLNSSSSTTRRSPNPLRSHARFDCLFPNNSETTCRKKTVFEFLFPNNSEITFRKKLSHFVPEAVHPRQDRPFWAVSSKMPAVSSCISATLKNGHAEKKLNLHEALFVGLIRLPDVFVCLKKIPVAAYPAKRSRVQRNHSTLETSSADGQPCALLNANSKRLRVAGECATK